jgi:hypothetical protein
MSCNLALSLGDSKSCSARSVGLTPTTGTIFAELLGSAFGGIHDSRTQSVFRARIGERKYLQLAAKSSASGSCRRRTLARHDILYYFLACQATLIERWKATGVPKLECALARQAIPQCLDTPLAAFPMPASRWPLMPSGSQRS